MQWWAGGNDLLELERLRGQHDWSKGEGSGQEKFCRTSLSSQTYSSPPMLPPPSLTAIIHSSRPSPTSSSQALSTVHLRPYLTQTLGLSAQWSPLFLWLLRLRPLVVLSLPLRHPTLPMPPHEAFIPQALSSFSPAFHFVSIAQSSCSRRAASPTQMAFPEPPFWPDLSAASHSSFQLPFGALLRNPADTVNPAHLEVNSPSSHPIPGLLLLLCLPFWLLAPD